MGQVEHRDRHKRQPVIGHGAPGIAHALPHMPPADIRYGQSPHVWVASPILASPAKRLFDETQQLIPIGRIGSHPLQIATVHLLGVLPPKAVEVDFIVHFRRREYILILVNPREALFNNRRVLWVNELILPLTAFALLYQHVNLSVDTDKVSSPELGILVPAQASHLGKVHQPPVSGRQDISVTAPVQARGRTAALCRHMSTTWMGKLGHGQTAAWKGLAEGGSGRVHGVGRPLRLDQ